MTIFLNIPIWVWPLFVLLLIIGLRATRPRRAPLLLILALPLLGGLSLRSLSALPDPSLVWAMWLSGIALGAVAGYRLQRRWLIDRKGMTVTLAGEWLTLVAMMVIFTSNFALGLAREIAPGLLSAPVFQMLVAVVLGLCAGSFLGRAIRTVRA